jgi:hypothetical protein
MIAEHGDFFGSTLAEFGHICSSIGKNKIKIEYKRIPDHILFDDFFGASDGYQIKKQYINGEMCYFAIQLHPWSYLLPRWHREVKHIEKKLKDDEQVIKRYRRKTQAFEDRVFYEKILLQRDKSG